jgi:hypothetical protein
MAVVLVEVEAEAVGLVAGLVEAENPVEMEV